MSDVSHDPASHYDRVTAAWGLLLGDELHYGVFETGSEDLPAATAALTDRMLAAARIEAGHAVLDVGCGTGTQACRLAAQGARVTGITTSAVGVATATARAAAAGVGDRATFEVRDGTANGFGDATFDRVWVLESSHLMRDRAALVAECSRVLRPGGRVALCDIVLRRPLPFEEVRRLRREFGLLRDVYGDAHMEPIDQYVERFFAAGIDVDVTADLTDATRPTFDRWLANAEHHRAEVVAAIGDDDWQRFVDSCGVLASFWDDGTLGYGLVAGSKGGGAP